MVEPPAAPVPGDALPRPACFPGGVPMEEAEGVAVTQVAQTGYNAELRLVPGGATFWSQLSSRVTTERENLPVGRLAAWRVQVPTEHSRSSRRRCKARPDRLERLDLHPAIGRIGDVDAAHLEPRVGVLRRECRLSPGDR